jgi:hypothetical protein
VLVPALKGFFKISMKKLAFAEYIPSWRNHKSTVRTVITHMKKWYSPDLIPEKLKVRTLTLLLSKLLKANMKCTIRPLV